MTDLFTPLHIFMNLMKCHHVAFVKMFKKNIWECGNTKNYFKMVTTRQHLQQIV